MAMTFIVRLKKPQPNYGQEYDVVDGATYATVGSAGQLILGPSRGSVDVIAVYAAGEWTSASEDDKAQAVLDNKNVLKLAASQLVNEVGEA